MERLIKNKKGITLVALVITVVVMLILAGVAIAAVDMQMGYLVEQEMQQRHIKMQ